MQLGLDALRRKANSAGPVLGLALLVCGVFGLAVWAPFIYDDAAFIFQNTDIIGPWLGWRHFFLDPNYPAEAYEPVIVAIHRVLVALFGSAPFWYRATSILLHLFNVVLFWALLKKVLKSEKAAWLFAAVFAVYPAHTEVVAISTFKKHLIVAAGALLLVHLERPWREQKPQLWRRALAFPLLAFALLTKEHGLLIPPIALTLSLALAADWRKRLRRDLPFYAALAVPCLAFVYFRSIVVPRPPTGIIGDSLALHWLTSLKCLLWYTRELLLPWQLCQEQSLAPVRAVVSFETAGLLLAAAAGAAALWQVFRRDRVAFAGLTIALIWLAPFLNIVPYLNVSLVANRYLYFAIAGVLLCAARLSEKYWSVKLLETYAAPAAACVCVGLLYTSLAMRNLARYGDRVDVWTCAVECAADNPRAHASLGQAYAAHYRWADAEREFRATVRLGRGFSAGVVTDLAMTYAQQGDFHKAGLITEELSRYWIDWRTIKLLGACKLYDGQLEKARRALLYAIHLNQKDEISRVNLGVYYMRVNKRAQAEQMWKAAAELPDQPALPNKYLAELYVLEKRPADARRAYEKSLEDEPLQVDAVSGLAALYAGAGEREKGRLLIEELVRRLEAQAAGQAKLADEASPAEERVSLQALEAAHRARASFLSRFPAS